VDSKVLRITYSKGRCEASFHPSVPSSICPFVPSWSVYSNGAEKEWNTDTAQRRIIYVSVVNFSLSQRLKELGWGFFFFEILFRILEIFNAFYIAIIFYYNSNDARASSC
jgi:hypothetical protein